MTRCKRCGAEFCQKGGLGRKKVKVLRYFLPCCTCGEWFEHKQARARYCGKRCKNNRPRPLVRSTCDCCGVEYEAEARKGKPRFAYCSVACANKHKWVGRDYPARVAMARIIDARGFSVHWYNQHLRAGYSLKPCVDCGTPHGDPRAVVCVLCRDEHILESRRRYAWERRRGRIVECPNCAVQFCWLRGTEDSPIGRNGFCSEECRAETKAKQQRIIKAKRRAAKRAGENIDPIEVFVRDGWKCRGCGCWTPEELRGTCHDNAPEMDHIHPLAKGGGHTWRNVQTLCRICNQLKRDMTWVEFKEKYL